MRIQVLPAPAESPFFSIGYDGDDEPGDPSGLFIVILGISVGIYWPVHGGGSWSWKCGGSVSR